MNYGIKIAHSGEAVQTAELKELLFDSTLPVLKNAYTGTGVLNYEHNGLGFDEVVYTHNLGYIPRFVCFAEIYNAADEILNKGEYILVPKLQRLIGAAFAEAGVIPYVNETQFRISAYSTNFTEPAKPIQLEFGFTIYYNPENE